MSLGNFTKQPAEKVDFDLDYSDWLTGTDALASAVVTVFPLDLLIPQTNVSSYRVKVWTAGGVHGVTYTITVTATTDDGRIKQSEFKVKVKDT